MQPLAASRIASQINSFGSSNFNGVIDSVISCDGGVYSLKLCVLSFFRARESTAITGGLGGLGQLAGSLEIHGGTSTVVLLGRLGRTSQILCALAFAYTRVILQRQDIGITQTILIAVCWHLTRLSESFYTPVGFFEMPRFHHSAQHMYLQSSLQSALV